MIKRSELLAMSYYERASFTGSDSGTRYRIERVDGEDDAPRFLATVWPEPFAFAHTPDEKKTSHTEDFSEEGLDRIVSWLNAQTQQDQ